MFGITHLDEGAVQCSRRMRQRLWNQFGNAKFMLYCRFRSCSQLNHKGAGIAGVKPHYLQFKKIGYFSFDLRSYIQQLLNVRTVEQGLGVLSLSDLKLVTLGSFQSQRAAPASWAAAGIKTWPDQSCSALHVVSGELLKAKCFHKKLYFQITKLSQWRNVPSEKCWTILTLGIL